MKLHGLDDPISREELPVPGESYPAYCRRVSEKAMADEKRAARRDERGLMGMLARLLVLALLFGAAFVIGWMTWSAL